MLAVFSALSPARAYAAPGALDPVKARDCITGADRSAGITVRIVGCTKQVIFEATSKVADAVGNYMAPVLNVMATLAIIAVGFMLMGGNSPPWNEAILMVVKIGFATAIVNNASGYFMFVTGVLDDMISTVTLFNLGDVTRLINSNCQQGLGVGGVFSTVSPIWFGVDCALDTLVGGIYSGVENGMISFLVAAMFSGALGFLIAILGLAMIFFTFYMLSQALYIYLSAIVAIALLVIISPICVPAILFNSTRQYFTSWLGSLFNYVLQPIVLFAYMSMLLVAVGHVTFIGHNSIVYVVTGGQVDLSGAGNFGKFVAKALEDTTVMSKAITLDSKKASALLPLDDTVDQGSRGTFAKSHNCSYDQKEWFKCFGGVDYTLDNNAARDGRGFFGVTQSVTGLNWETLRGSDTEDTYKIKVVIAFLSGILTIYIFLELLKQMPYISQSLANGETGIPTFGGNAFSSSNNALIKNVQGVFGGGK